MKTLRNEASQLSMNGVGPTCVSAMVVVSGPVGILVSVDIVYTG